MHCCSVNKKFEVLQSPHYQLTIHSQRRPLLSAADGDCVTAVCSLPLTASQERRDYL